MKYFHAVGQRAARAVAIQCLHCGDCFDAETFEAHVRAIARYASTAELTELLGRLLAAPEERQ